MKHIYILPTLFLFLQTASCLAIELTLPERLASFIHVGAHRGGGLSPKRNTLAQFKDALAAGADIIETDLRTTKDGVVVIFHDKTMEKSTNCRGNIKNYTLASLSNCHFKTNQEPIPTFEEVLKWSVGKVIVNAEFKVDSTIIPAIKLMHDYNAQEWIYFQTRDRRDAYELARLTDPLVNLIFCAENENDVNWALNQNDPRMFAMEIRPRIQTKRIIEKAKSQNKLVSANSFDISPDEEVSGIAACDKLLNLGFTILITDQTTDCVRQRNAFQTR